MANLITETSLITIPAPIGFADDIPSPSPIWYVVSRQQYPVGEVTLRNSSVWFGAAPTLEMAQRIQANPRELCLEEARGFRFCVAQLPTGQRAVVDKQANCLGPEPTNGLNTAAAYLGLARKDCGWQLFTPIYIGGLR